MLTTRLASTFLFAAVAALGACAPSDDSASVAQDLVALDDDAGDTGGVELGQQPSERPDEIIVTDDIPRHQDRFLAGQARVDGDTLVLNLRHGGGCEAHEIGLYWNGTVVETYPPQVDLHLRHDAKDDACRMLVYREMRFDLTAIRESARGVVVINVLGSGVDTRVRVGGESVAD